MVINRLYGDDIGHHALDSIFVLWGLETAFAHIPVTPTLLPSISSTSGIPFLSFLGFVARRVGNGRHDVVARVRGISPCGRWPPFAKLVGPCRGVGEKYSVTDPGCIQGKGEPNRWQTSFLGVSNRVPCRYSPGRSITSCPSSDQSAG